VAAATRIVSAHTTAARRVASVCRHARRRCVVTAALLLSVAGRSTTAHAQLRLEPSDRRFWLGTAVLVAGAAVVDERLSAYALAHHTPQLDRLADALDPLGRAKYLVPAMAGTYVATRLAGSRHWSQVALHVGLAYAASDIVESVLKPTVGRHRPDSTGDAWRFQPFSSGDEWHSFPSAHTVHATSIAAAVAEEVHVGWASALGYGVASLVGAQRVYTAAHWPSDVVASGALAITMSQTTLQWVHGRWPHGENARQGVRTVVLPGLVAASVPFR
jgi:membrane-associated phospholipid phosphatase